MMHNCRINNSNSSEYRSTHLQHLKIVDRSFISWNIYIYCVIGYKQWKICCNISMERYVVDLGNNHPGKYISRTKNNIA